MRNLQIEFVRRFGFGLIFILMTGTVVSPTPCIAESEDVDLLSDVPGQSNGAGEFDATSNDGAPPPADAPRIEANADMPPEGADTTHDPKEIVVESGDSSEDGDEVPILPRRTKFTRGASPNRMNLLLGVEILQQEATMAVPSMQVDYAVSVQAALGVSLGLLNSETSTKKVSGMSALGVLGYFPRGVYGGPVVQIGGGIRQYAAIAGFGTGLVFQGVLGWRWHAPESSGSFGISVGPDITRWSTRTDIAMLARIHIGVDFLVDDLFY